MADTTQIYLKPAEGRRVRKPDGSLLSDAGELVDNTPYWIRRVNAGDVVEAKAPAKPKSED